jgi:phosphonate transport system substrate-binding protein
VLAATATVGCRREQVGTKSDPFVLVLSPAHGTHAGKVARLQELLARESGLAVEIRVAPSSEAAVRMAGSVNTDAGLLTLFDYLFARRQYGVVAALRVERSGHSQKHRGEIVVSKSSGIETLAGLAHKRIAYVDRYSTTGFVLAANELKSAGVEVEHVFMGSHEAALAALRAGKVDAAATYEGALHDDPKLLVVTHTAFIPNEPVFFRKGLAAELRTKVTRALERIAGQPSGQAVLTGVADITGFSPTTDSAYDEAYEIISAAGKSVQDLVPRGWLLANENQRRPGDLAP